VDTDRGTASVRAVVEVNELPPFMPRNIGELGVVRCKLSNDERLRIADSVSIVTALEPVSMATLRLMKSEAIRVSKTLKRGDDRLYDSMTNYDLVLVIHVALKQRMEAELAIAGYWATKTNLQRLQTSLSKWSSGTVALHRTTPVNRLYDLVYQRLTNFGIVTPRYNLPVGNLVF